MGARHGRGWMSMAKELGGRTAIVTGASSGIGRAVAEHLARSGAHVFLSGRTAEALEDVREGIAHAGGSASSVVADLRDLAQVTGLVDRAVAKTGRLDVTVNNAGIEFPAAILDGRAEDWRAMLETNVLALLAGCRPALRLCRP